MNYLKKNEKGLHLIFNFSVFSISSKIILKTLHPWKIVFFLFWGVFKWNNVETTGCPKKHGNSVTNLISSWLWISIVIPNFKSHNVIMSAMNRVKDCKDVSIMSPQDEQWRRTSLLCLYTAIFFTKYNRMQSKLKQTRCEHSRRNSYRLQLSQ